jgi:protein-disulfide isomerase
VKITRRTFCQGTALFGAATMLASLVPNFDLVRLAIAQTPSPVDLQQPGPLGDMGLGAENAPVTIIEYASMTCGHCADFHNKTYPKLKERYIDTGKVRFIFREFPLDPLAAGAFMLARCAGKDDKDRYFALVETLFHQQREWVVQRPLDPLKAIAKQAGFSEQAFEQCLANQQVLNGIEQVRQRAAEKLGVNSTPTFFINGKIHRGAISIEDLEKQIDPYLKS